MIKIFAKKNTSEKVLVTCMREDVRKVQLYLSNELGGDWLFVDKLNSKDEILKFDDGLVYRGFHGRNERYVNGILKLSTHKDK